MKKNWNFSMAQFLWYDCTFKKQCTVPVTLTFDLWRSIIFQCIEYNPISILYEFQNDISSNSWEIKYQNIGRTHTQTHTHTHRQTDRQTDRVKTIPRNPLRGRGNNDTINHKYTRLSRSIKDNILDILDVINKFNSIYSFTSRNGYDWNVRPVKQH